MLEECEKGRIDLILTKSITRFARNTVDTLSTVRHLKEIGVSVYFEKEHLNTMTEESEGILTVYGAVAAAGVREHIPKRPLVSGKPVPAWYIRDKQAAVWLR